MKSTTKLMIVASILLLALCSCKKEESKLISIDKRGITVTSKQPASFTVKGNSNWYIEAPGIQRMLGTTAQFTDWYTIDKIMGNGSAVVTVSVNPEAKLPTEDKTETFNIVGDNNRLTISVMFRP